MRNLSAVENFGAIDADSDDLLRDCFQDHPAYLRVREMKEFLVLGRKGSGKTAIFKRLLVDSSATSIATGHSFDDYPWAHHELQAQTGVPDERRFVHSWKYLILIGLAKMILNSDHTQPWSEEAADSGAALEDFVIDSYGSRDPDFRQLFSPARQLRFKGSLRLGLIDIGGEEVAVTDLPLHVQEVNRAILNHILRALNPEVDYFVCFDQLDLGFSTLDASYAQRLVGLILASRDLIVAARGAGKRLNVPVFLRNDIYQDLQFEDKNKITENFVTEVRWSEEGSSLTLKKLMESRFGRVLSENPDDAGVHVPWNLVFDEVKEMPSRQSKYRHICDRTFLRPRDVIKFCNEILRAHTSSSASGAQFANESIHAARDAYSDYLLNELDDEIAKHVPHYKEYLEVLKELGSLNFSLEAFSNAWSRRATVSGIPPTAGLTDLFEFSVIGYLKPGGRGGGSEYVWRYRDPRARFNAAADTYRVHPGFKESLDLTRSSAAT